MLRTRITALAALLILLGCGDDALLPPEAVETFSFEGSLEGWTVRAGQLEAPGADYSVQATDSYASEGSGSAEFRLDNRNGNARVWLERVITLRPGIEYRMGVDLDLGTSDPAAATRWRLLTSAIPGRVINAADLEDRGATPVRPDAGEGVRFSPRTFALRVNSDPVSGEIVVAFGFWGVSAEDRAYYIDHLRLEFAEITASDGTPPIADPVN